MVTDPSRVISGFSADRSEFAMKARNTREALTRLLSRYFGRHSVSARAISELLHTISQEEPVELVDDVALLHAHVPFVTDTVVFLGVTKERLDIPLPGGGPHILIVLLDPVGQDPAKHLKALADIARIIRLPGFVSRLRDMRDFDEFRTAVEERTGRDI